MKKRSRSVFSIKEELLQKSREAALAAVQIFNNPNTTFKSETYIVLMIIAWTYMLHAYYRGQGIEYRYYKQPGSRRKFTKTKHGAYRYWELEKCLNYQDCPLSAPVVQNLKFLIGLRHEIEHQMTSRIDDLVSARFQACCINYHEVIVDLFGDKYGVSEHIALGLQFSALTEDQIENIDEHPSIPENLKRFIRNFDANLDQSDFESPQFAYRVIFIPKTANHVNQADRVISFVKADSELARDVNASYTVIKETERPKWLPGDIVHMMQEEGYTGFRMYEHTQLWKSMDAKNSAKGYGTQVARSWYWYESWLDIVKKHCKENSERYR